MTDAGELPHLVFVVGPTACGKSDFAVAAAEALSVGEPARCGRQAEIINCDSVQFFDGVNIGAAKPSAELLGRVPHHLVGHVPLAGDYTAGDFRRDALRVIHEQKAAGVGTFFAVGGSGFYVQALEKGMYDVPEIPSEVRDGLERDLSASGLEALHEELGRRDPEAARKIQSADRYRILRALQILRSSPAGLTLSAIRARFEATREPVPFRVSKIGLYRPRDILRRRVEERTRAMLAAGLVAEVEALRGRGLSGWGPLQSVGYREVQDFLDGKLTRAQLEPAIVTSTMQLAKRQMTWFKRDPATVWFDVEQGLQGPLAHVATLLEA